MPIPSLSESPSPASPSNEPEEVEPTEPAETPEPEEEVEPAEPEEPGEVEPTPPQPTDKPNNPLSSAGNELDELISRQITDELWKSLYSPLPCLDTSTPCVQQLQSLAVSNSPILKELDSKVEQINEKIEEAKVSNKQSINLSIFEPALQVFLQPQQTTATTGTTTNTGGFLTNLASLFTAPIPIVNQLFNAVGVPFLRSLTGGNEQQRAASIAISDLQVKVAQLQSDRAKFADTIRDKVQLSVLDFDGHAREFQISQAIAQRETQRLGLFQVGYRFGESSTESYLSQQSGLDRAKSATLREWSGMRGQLEKIKLLVLTNVGENEE